MLLPPSGPPPSPVTTLGPPPGAPKTATPPCGPAPTPPPGVAPAPPNTPPNSRIGAQQHSSPALRSNRSVSASLDPPRLALPNQVASSHPASDTAQSQHVQASPSPRSQLTTSSPSPLEHSSTPRSPLSSSFPSAIR